MAFFPNTQKVGVRASPTAHSGKNSPSRQTLSQHLDTADKDCVRCMLLRPVVIMRSFVAGFIQSDAVGSVRFALVWFLPPLRCVVLVPMKMRGCCRWCSLHVSLVSCLSPRLSSLSLFLSLSLGHTPRVRSVVFWIATFSWVLRVRCVAVAVEAG